MIEMQAPGLAFSGGNSHLTLSRGDFELRIGAWRLTLLWGAGPYQGGVFFETRHCERWWLWEDIRKALTSGRLPPQHPDSPVYPSDR